MGHRSPSFEASLLYQYAPPPATDRLAADLRAVFERNGETLESHVRVDEVFTLLTGRTHQVLLAFCPEPLPVEHFLSAGRPAAGTLGESQILARLDDIGATLTVLAITREEAGAGCAATMRDLCWDIAACLHRHAGADLVFWSDTDMLYTDGEFDRACAYAAQQGNHAPAAPVGAAPVLDDAVQSWIDQVRSDRATRLPDPVARDDSDTRLAGVLSRTVPNRMLLWFDRAQQGGNGPGLMNAAALSCTAATVAMTALPNLTGLGALYL